MAQQGAVAPARVSSLVSSLAATLAGSTLGALYYNKRAITNQTLDKSLVGVSCGMNIVSAGAGLYQYATLSPPDDLSTKGPGLLGRQT